MQTSFCCQSSEHLPLNLKQAEQICLLVESSVNLFRDDLNRLESAGGGIKHSFFIYLGSNLDFMDQGLKGPPEQQ